MSKKVKTKEDINRCGLCPKKVGESDKGLQCELCDAWFHCKCIAIKEELYELMQEQEGMHWFCKTCNSGAEKMLQIVLKMQANLEKVEKEVKDIKEGLTETRLGLEGRIEKCEQRIRALGGDVNDMQEKAKEQMDEKQQGKLWSDIVRVQVDDKFGKVEGEMSKVMNSLQESKERLQDERDHDSRMNNAIIHRVVESKADTSEMRYAEDLQFCLGLMQDALEMDIDKNDIKKISRLGKKGEGVRPLLVQFKSKVTKNGLMESLQKLRNAESMYKNLSIVHDMTKKERDECRKLVLEAKQKEESVGTVGEWIFRVRGMPGNMKIVKLKRY